MDTGLKGDTGHVLREEHGMGKGVVLEEEKAERPIPEWLETLKDIITNYKPP